MTTVNEGDSQVIEVGAGKMLSVTTAGEAYVDRIQNLPDAGFASDRVLSRRIDYLPRDLPFIVKVRAISEASECVVALPPVSSEDVQFRRDESGNIDALIDQSTGEVLRIGGEDEGSATWDTLDGKPEVIAAGSSQEEARQAIGAGTSNLAIGATADAAKAGDWSPSISDVTGLEEALGGKQASGEYATVASVSALELRITALEAANE